MAHVEKIKLDIKFSVPFEIWNGWIINRSILRSKAISLTKGNIDEADELLSSTIIKAINHIQKHGTVIHSPRSFFLIALKNEFISRNRRLIYERQIHDFRVDIQQDDLINLGDVTPDQEESLYQQELLERVLQAVETLTPIYQSLFQMRFCEERSYQDIAARLNISQALARKRVQLLRRKLLNLAPAGTECGGKQKQFTTNGPKRLCERQTETSLQIGETPWLTKL